jgi:hypothetical protein
VQLELIRISTFAERCPADFSVESFVLQEPEDVVADPDPGAPVTLEDRDSLVLEGSAVEAVALSAGGAGEFRLVACKCLR